MAGFSGKDEKRIRFYLLGSFEVSSKLLPFDAIAQSLPEVRVGGTWRHLVCKSRQKVAIIIPYRDREDDLRLFLNNVHRFLQKQLTEYGIYLVEQVTWTLTMSVQ